MGIWFRFIVIGVVVRGVGRVAVEVEFVYYEVVVGGLVELG